MQDSDVSFHSISNSVLSSEKITKEKLFFLAYIKVRNSSFTFVMVLSIMKIIF